MVKILLVIENDILCQLAFMKVPVYTYFWYYVKI